MCLERGFLVNASASMIKRRQQAGLGLPATIFLVVVMSLIVLALSELNESSSIGFGQDLQSSRAFYAAESGAQIALNRVFVGGTACSDAALADIDFDGIDGMAQCQAELFCNSLDVSGVTYYNFRSTATCGTGLETARRTVEVRARGN